MLSNLRILFGRIAGNLNWIRNQQPIYAVNSNDIENLLSLSILKSKLSCYSCGNQIDQNSLTGWVKFNGELVPFCDRPSCLPMKKDQLSEPQ